MLKINSEYYLEENIDQKSTKFATFLFLSQHIDAKKLVELLGANQPLNQLILKKYMHNFDFSNKNLVSALRLFCNNFLLFGEAQVIERIINEFCNEYFEENLDSACKNKDNVIVLTYALIMLNTDLYNPTVLKKITLNEFVNNCKKAVSDISEEYLTECYNGIQQSEIKTLVYRDFSLEEGVSKGKIFIIISTVQNEFSSLDSWLSYLNIIDIYDNNWRQVFSTKDKEADLNAIMNLNVLIDYHCYKKLIARITDNIELFITKSFLDPHVFEMLIEKAVRACAYYELLDNVDNLMVNCVFLNVLEELIFFLIRIRFVEKVISKYLIITLIRMKK